MTILSHINIANIATLDKKEKDIIINSLIPNGHEDSTTTEHHKDTFTVGDDRAFIIDYQYIPYIHLINSNVRNVEVDTKHCLDNILHKLQQHYQKYPKSMGLYYPVIVKKLGSGKYVIIHGHHRAWTCDYNGTDVPCIVISDHININGNTPDPNAENLGKARCNPGKKELPMKLADGALHLDVLWRTDKTLNGRNPSQQKPLQRKNKNYKQGDFSFEDFCDYAFGNSGNFESDVGRGRLYAEWSKEGSKYKTTEAHKHDNVTLQLASLGLDAGLNPKTQARLDVTQHIDIRKKAIVAIGDNNGRNFDGKIMSIIMSWMDDKEFRDSIKSSGIDKVTVAGHLHKPKVNLSSVVSEQEKFFSRCQRLSDALFKSTDGALRIDEVHMAKELKTKEDKGQSRKMKRPSSLQLIETKAV